jgi:outer membrane protein TolC
VNSLRHIAHAVLASVLVALAGCIAPATAERAARSELARAEHDYRPGDQRAALPVLTAESPLADFVRYAVLRHPQVEAAYADWRASVAAIAPTRALPDPQLTFEADIADTLMTFMPGLMFDVMTPGKRRAMANEMTATSNVARRALIATVLRTAADVRKAWIELAYATETGRLYGATIETADRAVELANIDYETGRGGMSSFEKQIRLQNIAAQHHAHHAAVSERVIAARAGFKAALGLAPGEADPPWPTAPLALTPLPPADELWQRASASNAELGQMRAMVDMAVASVDVARKAGTPDFSIGAMADLKASPLMVRPTATVTLPVWREKIRANIAAAQARHDAAVARVDAEQLNLAAELAQMLYMVHEAERMLAYIDGTALPNIDRGIATLEASVQSGMGSATMIADMQLMAIDMRHERLDMLRDRENAATDVLLMIADVAPADTPLLAVTNSLSP